MQKRTSSNNKTVLVYIGGIGFMFEVNQSLKHNLISPEVLAFFDGVLESGEITKDCAFPLPIPDTSLYQSIFQFTGNDWGICSDGIFRKCQKITCEVQIHSKHREITFFVDNTIRHQYIRGILSFDMKELQHIRI